MIFYFVKNKMSNPEAKRWCFTINNPTEEDIGLLIGTEADGAQAKLDEVEYMIFQEEKGNEEGTLHWQGFLILKKKKRLTWLKRNINGRAHWEVARGTNDQAIAYCRKEDTYTGGLRHEYGKVPEKPVVKKREERLQEAAEQLDLLKEGFKRPADIPSLTLLQCGFIPAMKELTADVLGPYRPELKILTLVGPPGTGKSYAIQACHPRAGRCIIGNNGVWFQNPLAEVMVFEEFNGQIQLQRMLQYLDAYPLALEVKGGMRPAMYKLVIITSNTSPDMWYPIGEMDDPVKVQRKKDAIHALYDRIGYTGGGYVPVRKCGTYVSAPALCDVIGMNVVDYINECRQTFMKAVCDISDIPEPITDDEE